MEQKMLGKVVSLDSLTRKITIEVEFLDSEKLEMFETLLKDRSTFTFSFVKPFRQSKSYAQLKKYYLLLHKLLNKLGIYPDADKIKALDEEVKKRVFNCDVIEFYGQKLPLIPSKANMSHDDMSKMIQFMYDNYGVLLEDETEI